MTKKILKMKLLLILIIACFGSCQSQQETKSTNDQKELKSDDTLSVQQKPGSPNITKATTLSSFLDSITKGYELTIEQIRNHTLIDSVYYTGIYADVGFTGDTVFNLYRGLKGAVIEYDDRRSCIYKFLLVLNPSVNQNTANKIIYTDCDHDESTDYTILRFKLVNDSLFETTETYISAKSRTKKIENLKWKIRNDGEVELLR